MSSTKDAKPRRPGGRNTPSNVAARRLKTLRKRQPGPAQAAPAAPRQAGASESGGGVSWFNCECFFSLVLVGLLAALPFNLHTNDLLQTRESYVQRAEGFFSDGAFDKAASLYERAVNAEETADGHVFLAETLVRVSRVEDAIRHYHLAADLYTDERDKVGRSSPPPPPPSLPRSPAPLRCPPSCPSASSTSTPTATTWRCVRSSRSWICSRASSRPTWRTRTCRWP